MSINAPVICNASGRTALPSLAMQAAKSFPDDIVSAATSIHLKARAFGVRLMIWPDLATLEPMLDATGEPINERVFGWSPEKLAVCHDRDNASGWPWLRQCRKESEAFDVGQSELGRLWKLLSPAAASHRNVAPGEPRTGIVAVPVHLPFGQIAAAIITPNGEPRAEAAEPSVRFAEVNGGAIRRFIGGYAKAKRDKRYLPPDTDLSKREIECLSWVALGKTDQEISVILGCSHAGVRYHLSRACAKLEAGNRAQCVFRASQLGYLSPGFATVRT